MRKKTGETTPRKASSSSGGKKPKMEISHASCDRVAGEMILGEEAEKGLPVRLGLIFDVADELSRIGIRKNSTDGHEMALVDAKTISYHARSADRLRAEANLMVSSGAEAVWVTKIMDGDENILAIVAQSFRKSEMISRAPMLVKHQKVAGTPGTNGEAMAKAVSKISLNRREKIALAACEVIAQKGFANATIRDIAEAANMHVPTLYQHLKNKDEILELVYMQVMDRIEEEIDSKVDENPILSKKEELIRLLTTLLSISNNYYRQVEVINRETKSLQPEARQRVIEKYKNLLRRFARIIQDGVDAGEFRPVEPFIAANLIESFCTLWALRPFSFNAYSLEKYRDEIVSFMMHGVNGNAPGGALN